ncbi:diacylglycerol kinase eta [Arctopsyche grandis]|uniref:diacylglycerol kinase eta n=1 Tax=Arctopsyche grandis TaxID=121162 RepID=UPI00406D70DC
MAAGARPGASPAPPRTHTDTSDSDDEPPPTRYGGARSAGDSPPGPAPKTIKEGYLMKQTWSFQRWQRRFFRLRGRILYYAKYRESSFFDEIELIGPSFSECNIKNVNHSFQVITPCRSLVLCAETRRDMEEWLSALKSAVPGGPPDMLNGEHHWYATSHARPTYCNVCREALHGVPPHGLSCEVCKCKAHKRCAGRTPPNCKWTTLASIGSHIIEDEHGNITMPHQWMEGNLPVASKCGICDKTCGSVLRLQDWRCLWCRVCVHSSCRPGWRARCPLPPWRVSLVPPTALHAAADDGWRPERPPHASPLLVFVNSKSGDNQGVKFLRRFKQLLNPAQVFDLTAGGGPGPGLKLFRHLDPFRVLVCSGDGSVGWVLAEIDNLNMHKQCQVAVLPLGTGNDLARVLGWGASCDDDAHLPLLLERYEQASAKMLDRWSIMAFERPLGSTVGSSSGGTTTGERGNRTNAVEEAINAYLDTIGQSVEAGCTNVAGSYTTESLCEAVQELTWLTNSETTRQTQARLASLLDALRLPAIPSPSPSCTTLEKHAREKTEKEEVNERARLAGSRATEIRRRADNLRKAVNTALHPPDTLKVAAYEPRGSGSWELLPAPRQFADGSRRSSATSEMGPPSDSIPDVDEDLARLFPMCISQASKSPDQLSACEPRDDNSNKSMELPSLSDKFLFRGLAPSFEFSGSCANLMKLRESNESRGDSSEICDVSLFKVPCLVVSNEKSYDSPLQRGQAYESDKMTIIDIDEEQTKISEIPTSSKRRLSRESPAKRGQSPDPTSDDKDLSDILSAMSNEECSVSSDVLDQKPFQAPQNLDGEDVNGHICHIDSPETSDTTTCPNSETIHGESIMDDMSSVLGQDLILAMIGKNGEIENTFTDETTLFTSDTTSELQMDSRNPSLEKYDDRIFNFLHKSKKKDLEEKFGFENKVFNLAATTETVKYCSLAQFVEGNDIARKSFKRHLRHSSKKKERLESALSKQNVLDEEVECLENTKDDLNKGSCNSNLSSSVATEETVLEQVFAFKEDFEKEFKPSSTEEQHVGFNLKITEEIPYDKFKLGIDITSKLNDEMKKSSGGEIPQKDFLTFNMEMDSPVGGRMFPRVSVVVEPPSPSSSDGQRGNGIMLGGNGLGGNGLGGGLLGGPLWPRERRCSDNGPRTSLDVERCPSATRRISCGSLFQPGEAGRLSKSASSIWGPGTILLGANKNKNSLEGTKKTLPIINPLVRLPAWPHVSGLVGRCLLANADALCAAVSPLMDPQETLLEGFYERSVMNNYFGIGIDAKISLDFHQKREEHPEKCRSRARNYMWYGVLGSREWVQRTYRHLGQRVQLECDGQKIPLPELQGIVVLNIPSFMGGTNFWGCDGGGPFLPPSFDDRVLEVVAVFGSAQMAASRLINLQRHRIAQCRNVQINILGSEGVPVQVDGEAWLQPPGMIRIMHKNRAQVLCRSRALETSLKTWGEKQKLTSAQIAGGAGSGTPLQTSLTHATSLDELPPAELAQLLVFIETANTLIKWLKMSSITASGGSEDGPNLYARACDASTRVDNLTPSGRLLPAGELRQELAKLAKILAELCTSGESIGGSPQLQQALKATRQQLTLVKDQGGLASLQPPDSETDQRGGRRGWLRSAGRRRSSVSVNVVGAAAVKLWGTSEVETWLNSLQLGEHVEAFASHDITGRELLSLARRDLRDLGVTKVGHVKRILQAIKDLQ